MAEEKLLIKNGYVVDGSGEAGREADLLVEAREIIEIAPGLSKKCDEAKVIDASGLVVAPGFIDIHSHSDLSLLEDGRGLSKSYQGVTTEVVGNCSLGPAPVTEENRQEVKNTFSYLAAEVDWDWTDYEQYLQRLQGSDVALNLCPLAGYGNIRAAVNGFQRGELPPEQLSKARELLDEVMRLGARGLSVGLVYIPCCYAELQELVLMARVLKSHDGLFAAHLRNEGHKLLEALDEIITVMRASGVRTEISHLKAAGKPNWGLAREAAEKIYELRDQGWELGFDLYPYLVGSTYLSALLPRWAREKGREGLTEILSDSDLRSKIKQALDRGSDDWPGYPGPGALRPEGIKIGSVASSNNQNLVGRSVTEIAEQRGAAPWDCFLDLLLEEQGQIIGLYEYMDEADVEYLYSTPAAAVGSDGLAIPPEGHWLKTRPHPRYYGTFPRFLRRYVREKKLMTLEEAVRRITSIPADRLGLKNRGRLQPGLRADVVIFDPQAITDQATYDDPHRLSRGIEYLFVNGEAIIYNGSSSKKFPGQLLLK